MLSNDAELWLLPVTHCAQHLHGLTRPETGDRRPEADPGRDDQHIAHARARE
jgi:hypothetical protein